MPENLISREKLYPNTGPKEFWLAGGGEPGVGAQGRSHCVSQFTGIQSAMVGQAQ